MKLALAHSAEMPPPGDDRAALRAALATCAAAAHEMDGLKAARARAADMVDAAERRLETARGAIERAQEQQAASMLESATTGKTMKSGGAIRAARDAEREALDELEAARAVVAKIAGKMDYPRHGVTGSPMDPVSEATSLAVKAAGDVIRNTVRSEGRVRRAGQLLSELQHVRVELASLLNDGLARPEERRSIIEALAPVPNFPSVRDSGGVLSFYALFDASPWDGLREKLLRDPDAPITETNIMATVTSVVMTKSQIKAAIATAALASAGIDPLAAGATQSPSTGNKSLGETVDVHRRCRAARVEYLAGKLRQAGDRGAAGGTQCTRRYAVAMTASGAGVRVHSTPLKTLDDVLRDLASGSRPSAS